MDLINELAAIHGYRSYLEICTYTTGRLYADLDRGRFTISHRLMYRCPESFDDGLPIDFRSASSEIATQLTALRASGVTYDLILVDPFHDYEQSLRDLRAARGLLAANRTIVVHDCPTARSRAGFAGVPRGCLVRRHLQGLSRFHARSGSSSAQSMSTMAAASSAAGLHRHPRRCRGRGSSIACAGRRRLLRWSHRSTLPMPEAPS